MHSNTHQQLLTLFRLVEEKGLRPLPVAPFEIATWHQAKVARDCHIQVSGTLYSMPYQYVGKTVDVKLGAKVVEVGAYAPQSQLKLSWPGWMPSVFMAN